jgi:hypothetical protein
LVDEAVKKLPRHGQSTAQILTWRDDHRFIDDLYQQAKLDHPPCMDFMDHVDWPFKWEASEDEDRHRLGFIVAADYYLERRWWRSAHDPEPVNTPRNLVLALVRDIHAKLEQIERERREIHQELTRRPPTRDIPDETIAVAAATPPGPVTVVRPPGEESTIDGEPAGKLTEIQYAILKELVEAPGRLSMKDLRKRMQGRCDQPEAVLAYLLKKKPLWQKVVSRGGPRSGYGLIGTVTLQ